MDKKYVVRGKTMTFTSTDPNNYGEEITYDTIEEAKKYIELVKLTFPFERFEVKEV